MFIEYAFVRLECAVCCIIAELHSRARANGKLGIPHLNAWALGATVRFHATRCGASGGDLVMKLTKMTTATTPGRHLGHATLVLTTPGCGNFAPPLHVCDVLLRVCAELSNFNTLRVAAIYTPSSTVCLCYIRITRAVPGISAFGLIAWSSSVYCTKWLKQVGRLQ